jgi:hypothetical protein
LSFSFLIFKIAMKPVHQKISLMEIARRAVTPEHPESASAQTCVEHLRPDLIRKEHRSDDSPLCKSVPQPNPSCSSSPSWLKKSVQSAFNHPVNPVNPVKKNSL